MAGLGPVTSFPVAAFGGDNSLTPGALIFRGTNATTNQVFLAAGHLIFLGVIPTAVLAAPHVTWIGAEVLHGGASAARTSWTGAEVLVSITPTVTNWVLSWIGVETLHDGAAAERAAWIGAEIAHDGAAKVRLSCIGVEVLRSLKDVVVSGWVSLLVA